jgi:hypothetical protein
MFLRFTSGSTTRSTSLYDRAHSGGGKLECLVEDIQESKTGPPADPWQTVKASTTKGLGFRDVYHWGAEWESIQHDESRNQSSKGLGIQGLGRQIQKSVIKRAKKCVRGKETEMREARDEDQASQGRSG